MWLAWEIAAVVSLFLGVSWLIVRRIESRSAEIARPFVRELSLMFCLYAIWQLAGEISVINKDGAFRRARQLWDLERLLLMPNEVSMQEWLLPHGWLVQTANIYYATVHVPAVIICLTWLFLRDRHYYSVTRNNLAMLTGASLLIQLVAVAPPRFLTELGIVDTAVLYNQSVFSSLGFESAGQLQAMPSIHVGWSLLVAVATWRIGTGWWRWIGTVHAVITTLVVVVTANHFWLDGVAAGAILAGAMLLQHVVRARFFAEPDNAPSGPDDHSSAGDVTAAPQLS